MKLLRKLKLLIGMCRYPSKVPTGLVPLSALRTAVLYLASPFELTEPQKLEISGFFQKYGITAGFIYADTEVLKTDAELFISLSVTDDIFERHAAVTSTARFKVGRHQLKNGTYDFVLSDVNPEEPVSVTEAFNEISKFLITIQ